MIPLSQYSCGSSDILRAILGLVSIGIFIFPHLKCFWWGLINPITRTAHPELLRRFLLGAILKQAGQLLIIFPAYVWIILLTLGEKTGIDGKGERAWVILVNEKIDCGLNSQGNTFNAFLNCGSTVVPVFMHWLHSWACSLAPSTGFRDPSTRPCSPYRHDVLTCGHETSCRATPPEVGVSVSLSHSLILFQFFFSFDPWPEFVGYAAVSQDTPMLKKTGQTLGKPH